MFLHVDIDAFFASVEQLDHPEYRGKPVIVGGLPGDVRRVVSTCSYEARKFGVHSAMPLYQALKLCPQGIYLRGRMQRYLEKSAEVMGVFDEFSPDVQQMSVDEAFLDIGGTERLFGPPEAAARLLKQRTLERTGLTVSVGLGSNKYVAKIASGMSKPDGLFIVPPGDEEKFMLSLPISKLWGVGGKTRARLASAGYRTTEDIHRSSLELLSATFGKAGGAFLYRAVRGMEAESFDGEAKSRSLSAERTYREDMSDRFVIETALLELCQIVVFRLLRQDLRGRTARVKIRYGDFSTVSIQETGDRDVSSVDDLYERCLALFDKKYKPGEGVRLLGVGVQNVSPGWEPVQGQLFDFGEGKKRLVEQAIMKLQKKDPRIRIKKARLLKSCAKNG
ncbi:MAG: DNA polymerase IV [Spirochaetaceae bacterium]|jgi:DNA polymerase-4|nr:DNA polymerase IV [Spirochaetaceae bacterium]